MQTNSTSQKSSIGSQETSPSDHSHPAQPPATLLPTQNAKEQKRLTQSRIKAEKLKKSLFLQMEETFTSPFELDVINSPEFARVLRKAKAVNPKILEKRIKLMEELREDEEPCCKQVTTAAEIFSSDLSSLVKIIG